MTIIHLPEELDHARDNAIEAREWQAQERATRAERLHLSDADDAYRHVARALRNAPPAALPADFARRIAMQVGAATQDLRLDLRLERHLLLAACTALAVAVPAALALYGGSGLEIAAAVFPALSQAAPGWVLALAACVALNGLMEPLRRRLAAR